MKKSVKIGPSAYLAMKSNRKALNKLIRMKNKPSNLNYVKKEKGKGKKGGIKLRPHFTVDKSIKYYPQFSRTRPSLSPINSKRKYLETNYNAFVIVLFMNFIRCQIGREWNQWGSTTE